MMFKVKILKFWGFCKFFFNKIKTYIILEVRKLGFFTLYIKYIKLHFLDLFNFLLFSLPLPTLLSFILLKIRIKASLRLVFNIKISEKVISLKL